MIENPWGILGWSLGSGVVVGAAMFGSYYGKFVHNNTGKPTTDDWKDWGKKAGIGAAIAFAIMAVIATLTSIESPPRPGDPKVIELQ